MKIFKVRKKVGESGEYILGARETGSHACYLIYGKMNPEERGRKLQPGKGHEELVIAAHGDLTLTGHHEGVLKEGEAIQLREDEICWLENVSSEDAVYIISGGHSEGGHQ